MSFDASNKSYSNGIVVAAQATLRRDVGEAITSKPTERFDRIYFQSALMTMAEA